jgi:hypothetical protein
LVLNNVASHLNRHDTATIDIYDLLKSIVTMISLTP